ncbi:MAG: hypothetical protein RLZZ488_893 [Pseudomonadota bacterium]|jgi:hypothetical protein
MSAFLVPLAMFLINETTKDVYVLPPEAAANIEGAKPCAPLKATIAATTFTAAMLDQLCTVTAQGLLPKISSQTKTSWSVEHAQTVGQAIRSLQSLPNLRSDAPAWPPEIPFSLSGLTSSSGMSVVIGVKTPDKQPAIIERIDAWSNVDDRLTRAYWSRSMNDPTYAFSQPRIIGRMGLFIQRAWKGQSKSNQRIETLKVLVDKKISEREIALIESVVKAYAKGAGDNPIAPVEVRKDGIVYQTAAGRVRLNDIVARLQRDLPAFKSQALADGPADISIMLSSPN